MGYWEQTHLVKEATWCIANISVGQSNHIESLVNKGLFRILYDTLNSDHEKIYEQAAWVVGNISADNSNYRIEMRRMGYPEIMTKKILESDSAELVKYSNWALSNLCRGDVTSKGQRESIAAFIKVILTYTDEEMLRDALMCLTDLMDNQMIDAFIEAGLMKKMAELSQAIIEPHSFIHPIVQIVCLINAGNHDQCKHCVECGFVDILFKWVQFDDLKDSLKKEILYCMSNFTIDSDEISNFVLSNESNYTALMKLCYHENTAIRTEAVWSFCNATKVSSDERVYKMVQNNILKLFADCLAIKDDASIVLIIFEGVKNIFNRRDKILALGNGQDLIDFQAEAEKSGLCNRLEECQRHPNMNVYMTAQYIIKAYFTQQEQNSVLDKFYNYVVTNEKID